MSNMPKDVSRQAEGYLHGAGNVPTFEELVKLGHVNPEIEEEYGTSYEGYYDATRETNHTVQNSARLIVVNKEKGTGRSFFYNKDNDIAENPTPAFVLGLEN